MSSFVMRQVADWPPWSVIELPLWVPPTHAHVLAAYPEGPPDSAREYATPAVTSCWTVDPGPLKLFGSLPDVAESVHWDAVAVPPLLLMTCLTSVRCGLSVF